MMTGDSPAGARLRLRLALRKLRDEAGFTQGQIAAELSWSISKVNRIEKGDVTISQTDLQALLRLLGARDGQEIGRLLEDARLSRVKGWWDRPEYRAHINPATRRMFQFESEATAVRSFQIMGFPGILQTRDYAAATIGAIPGGMSEETRSVRVEARMFRREFRRQARLRPNMYLIIDEFLLQRVMGSAAIMAAQLHAVAEAAREADLFLRLLPKEEPKFLQLGSFTLYDVGSEGDAGVLYREAFTTDGIEEDAEVVAIYRNRFEQMWQCSLQEDATLSAIEARIALIRADLDRYS